MDVNICLLEPNATIALMSTITSRLRGVLHAYVEVVRGRSYVPLWLSQLVSNFGDTLHSIALVVLADQMTGQGTAASVLSALRPACLTNDRFRDARTRTK
jgi:hypothetical protein